MRRHMAAQPTGPGGGPGGEGAEEAAVAQRQAGRAAQDADGRAGACGRERGRRVRQRRRRRRRRARRRRARAGGDERGPGRRRGARRGGARAGETLEELLEEIADGLGLDVEVEVEEGDGVLTGRVDGEDVGLFIGRRRADDRRRAAPGPADRVPRRPVVGARGDRRRRLPRATRARSCGRRPTTRPRRRCSSGEPVELDPMPPWERRIVHEHLRDRGGVETHSEGEEPDRYLVVSPLGELRRPAWWRRPEPPGSFHVRSRRSRSIGSARRPSSASWSAEPCSTLLERDEHAPTAVRSAR